MRFDAGITGVIFCSVATATNFSFTAYGSGAGESARLRLAALSFCPDIAAGAHWSSGDRAARSGHEHEGFNMLGAEFTELARCIRETSVLIRSASTISCTAWRSSTPRWHRPRPAVSLKSQRSHPHSQAGTRDLFSL
jgi:hypothetical protein